MPDLVWNKSRPRPSWFDQEGADRLQRNRHEYAQALYRAQPSWACTRTLRAIYRQARRRGLTVDHLVPIRHPHVCGLHVPANLRLAPLGENVAKGNRTWPDMWHEQLSLLPEWEQLTLFEEHRP